MTKVRTACVLCSRNCGLEVDVDVENNRITSVRGDPQHPASQGYLCQKAARLDYYQNNEDRLTRPLRRRANGNYEPVSWDTALHEIATKLKELRSKHGGKCFAFYGGGGQGNHLGGAYTRGLLDVMGSPYRYSALAQEKTGDFWVNGRLFGAQNCHISEDIEHSDFVLFIGTNPWQAHGIRNARETLRSLGKSKTRKMVVIDPRRTETANLAHLHLQIRPGTDAFLLAAMLAIMSREGLFDRDFIATRTTGFAELEAALQRIPLRAYIERAGVRLADVEAVARQFARAECACVRVDLGIQQSLHSTLNSYLEKLLFLLTGNFGKPGGNSLHSWFMPIVGHSDEGPDTPRTTAANMAAIARLFPPNLLPGEIDNERPDRVRALFVDSANPLLSGADTHAYESAVQKLELLVVVDVAMTETARFAHYVLPAASQFEKWEATGFNLEFPKNYFHLRAPLFPASDECLPEPEIYTRLLRALGALPRSGFPILTRIAKLDRRVPQLGLYLVGLVSTLALQPSLRRCAAHVLYETLGKALPENAAAAAPLWFLAHSYALRHRAAVRRAGYRGFGLGLGEGLFRAILGSRSGVEISEHRYADTWSFVRHRDRKVHLQIPELLSQLEQLAIEPESAIAHPFVLIAGERRSYNANTLYRDPAWRKHDRDGALNMHPADAERLGLSDGDLARCRSERGEIIVLIRKTDTLRPGVVSLPHGYGLNYNGEGAVGPMLNRLTSSTHRDSLAGTPFHKYVPVQIEPL